MDTELTVTVTDPAGNTKTFDSHAPDPMDRPQGLTFSTQQGSGFFTSSFTLSCPIDYERDDIGIPYAVKITGSGGDTAYEGFIAAMPRSMGSDGQATLTITCAGYMATANGKSFTEIFVDRDLSRWQDASTSERVRLIGLGFGQVNGAATTPDQSGRPVLRTGATGPWLSVAPPYSSAVYDAGSNTAIGQVIATWTRGASVSAGDPLWAWQIVLSDGDTQVGGSLDASGDLQAAGPDTETLAATTGTRRFAILEFYYGAAAGTDGVEYAVEWSDVAVYGDHGLPIIGDAPGGVAASDVIRYVVGRYCPLLNVAGPDTTYAIHQLAFTDRTKPYDSFLKVNSYHLLPLAVWEDRTLHFGPATDLTDYDWEIRHDEVGNTIGLQGDEYTDLRNRIIVQYTDVTTGRVETLHPDDYAELRDDSPDNFFNLAGWEWEGEPFTIPFPTTAANALELGRIRLVEDNQPKAPGSFTVQYRIKDRAGVEQPLWKVRAYDRIKLTSSVSLSSRPRLIGETSFSDDGKTITITVDGTSRVLDAYMDRVNTALAAEGLA